MPRPTHYSPCIDRFLVKALYYEAKRRGKPMTVLTDEMVSESLQGTDGWKSAAAEIPVPERFLVGEPSPETPSDP